MILIVYENIYQIFLLNSGIIRRHKVYLLKEHVQFCFIIGLWHRGLHDVDIMVICRKTLATVLLCCAWLSLKT